MRTGAGASGGAVSRDSERGRREALADRGAGIDLDQGEAVGSDAHDSKGGAEVTAGGQATPVGGRTHSAAYEAPGSWCGRSLCALSALSRLASLLLLMGASASADAMTLGARNSRFAYASLFRRPEQVEFRQLADR